MDRKIARAHPHIPLTRPLWTSGWSWWFGSSQCS
jgi:hypothetical protein